MPSHSEGKEKDEEAARALAPPAGPVSLIGRDMVRTTIEASRKSPRGRVIQPLHKAHGDPLHRMLNAVQPGSYVRPHRHARPPKSECFVVLRGRAAFFVFAGDGTVKGCHILAPDAEHFGVDVEPGVYHGFAALEEDTVIFEAKTGPYDAASDKDFAPWAPEEGTPEAEAYLKKLLEDVS